MNHDNEHYQLIQQAAQKSFQLLQDLNQNPLHFSEIMHKYINLTRDMYELSVVLMQNPEQLWKAQTAYWIDAIKLMQEQYKAWMLGHSLPIADKRFEEQGWLQNPYYNMLGQYYLLVTSHINSLIDNLQFSDKNLGKRMKFFVHQYMDAISPSNFIATNPQLMAETMKSQGINVLRGLNNLLNDLEAGSIQLNVTMTDKSAFRLGENLAITPGRVIFRNSMIELIQYTPAKSSVYSIPLLMIPPWINKYYILDLSANNSLVKWLVDKGLTVFMISWVNPDGSYADKTLYDYLKDGPLTAIDVIKKQMDTDQVNTLGFCLGGTLQAMMLAYQKAHGDNSVKSATFMATLLDFSNPGDISVFIDEQQILKLEETMKRKGYLAGNFMASSFNALRANDLVWSFFIKNYLQGKQAAPFDILYWNSDSTNMPATMHSQYLRWMYLHNRLMNHPKIILNHTTIDVGKIDIPSFFVGTEKDHIAPWKSTWSGYSCLQGKKQFLLGGSGHIAGIVNPPSAKKYGYYTNDHLADTAEEWRESASYHEGSWWPEWWKWLSRHSGKKTAAPDWQNLPLKGLMDAPGTYVKVISKKEH